MLKISRAALPVPSVIAVDPDNAGQGAAVGIKRGWAVVRLYLKHQVIIIAPGNNPGIVLEHGDAPVALCQALSDGTGRALDKGIKQAPDFANRARTVVIGNGCVEYLMLAVLRPGLGQHLKLNIGCRSGHALGAPR